MKNIAVLIYGRLDKCVDTYENVIGKVIGSIVNENNKVHIYCSSDNSSKIDDFIRLYKPVSWVNDPITHSYTFEKYPKAEETNIYTMGCHFINKKRVFELLLQNKEEYDLVVSLRADLIFENSFDFSQIEDNTIYIPIGADWRLGINDQVAYGKPDVMKKYNEIIDNCENLLQNQGCIVHPESLTYSNILYHNLKIKRVNVKYKIIR